MKSESGESEEQEEQDEDEDEDEIDHHTEESARNVRRSPRRTAGVRWNQNVKHPSERGSVRGSTTKTHPYRKSSMISGDLDDGMERALRSWNKFRFVQAGWFTAREAISFVE